jgi:CheY-like chemotaxis protein
MQDPINWRILLIDDEEDIRDVISLVLRDAAYTVESAADGVAGLEMVGRFNPHIVITDIRMPRMDGLALLKEVKIAPPRHRSDRCNGICRDGPCRKGPSVGCIRFYHQANRQ